MCPFSHLGSLLGFLIHFYKLTRHRFNNNVHSYGFFHLRGPWIALQTHQCNIEIPCRRIRLLSAQLQQEFGWLRNARGCKRHRGRKLEPSTHGRRTWREGCSMGAQGRVLWKEVTGMFGMVLSLEIRTQKNKENAPSCISSNFWDAASLDTVKHGKPWELSWGDSIMWDRKSVV